MASTLSPLEVKVRDQDVCTACHTKDCIRGQREPATDLVVIRGCELALFQPRKGRKHGLHVLPGLRSCLSARQYRNPEPAAWRRIASDPLRSGIGYFSQRKDLAALAIVFTFGALLNAFGMVSPVYAVESWLGRMLHVRHEAPVLGIIFAFFLILEPVLFCWDWPPGDPRLVGQSACTASADGEIHLRPRPMGFGMWLAHYGFHFLTGLYTFIPVTQSALASLGWPVLGEPRWTLTGLPQYRAGDRDRISAAGICRIAGGDHIGARGCPGWPLRAFVPWAAVSCMLWVASMWLMFQPMEMRATLMSG